MALLDGLIVIDKPRGPTSHDVVARIRRLLGGAKTGHCGTLDPEATGVLLVAVGRAARLFPFLSGHDKGYAATVRFGFATDTYDASGRPTIPESAELPAEGALREAMRRFEGRILQAPPAYSAIKKDGQPLYKLARANREVPIEPREVVVRRFELVSWVPPLAAVDIECSAGTYVRSLAHDLGRALGCGAHLASLRRTASGPFRLEDARTLDDVESMIRSGEPDKVLLPMEGLLPEFPALVLSPEGSERARHGNRILPEHVLPPPRGTKGDPPGGDKTVFRLFGGDGRLVALARPSGEDAGLSPFLVVAN
jgi:tRNA pseudouridine55 synthase